jgi:hypothetical protein
MTPADVVSDLRSILIDYWPWLAVIAFLLVLAVKFPPPPPNE